ncbi:hypothetical protein AB4Y44_10030 [Paraburkholderia sp. BR10937]
MVCHGCRGLAELPRPALEVE